MSPDLREELVRLADSAPRVEVDPSTWDRGRAARRRDRAVLVAAVIALVASLGGIGALVARPAPAGPADGEQRVPGGAVPSMVTAPPEHLSRFLETGLEWRDDVRETDLAIGRASVAFPTEYDGGLPVVVTAADGVYHLLELPDYVGLHSLGGLPLSDGSQSIALSPDGAHLAWSYGRPAAGREDYSPVHTGIRVADLLTGEVREIDLRPALTEGQAVIAATIVWSPDSRWIAWQGREMRQWNASGSGSHLASVAGRIAPDSTSSEQMPGYRAANRAIAITSEGLVVTWIQAGRAAGWDGEVVRRLRIEQTDLVPVGAASPDGRFVAAGSFTPRNDLPVLELATGELLHRSLSDQVYPAPPVMRPLGWIDDTTVVAVVQPQDDDQDPSTPQLVVMTAPDRPKDSWTYRIVGSFDPAVPTSDVTVAVDLMTLERPAVDFGEPDWPWSVERKLWTGALAAVTVLIVLGLASGALRRRRLSAGS